MLVGDRIRTQIAPKIVPLWTDTRRFNGLRGGRGSAKSHSIADRLVVKASTRHVRAACMREIQDSIKDSVKQLLEDKIEKHFGWDQRLFHITEREITCRETDSLFIFRGLQNHTAASIKSLEAFTDAWYAESQTLTQRSLDLATPTFRTSSEQIFDWNPDKATDPVDRFFLENVAEGDPDFLLIDLNYYDNPWFPDELRRDMERDKRRDPDKYANIWLGKYRVLSGARVFTNWTIEEFETPADAWFHFGADWGFSIDPSVMIRCFAKGDKLFVDQEAYAVGCEIDNTPALFAGSDTQSPPRWSNPNGYPGISGALIWPLCADSARPETISYMRRHGFSRIRPSIKGVGSVEDGIEFLKNFDIVVHPRCVHTIDELSSYSWKVDRKTEEVLPILEDKKNHVIDALRYALESTRRGSYTLANTG